MSFGALIGAVGDWLFTYQRPITVVLGSLTPLAIDATTFSELQAFVKDLESRPIERLLRDVADLVLPSESKAQIRNASSRLFSKPTHRRPDSSVGRDSDCRYRRASSRSWAAVWD